MKTNCVEVAEEIRMLSMYLKMLIRFSLVIQDETINCAISGCELADMLLMLPEKSELAAYGYLNKRNQLIIDRILVRNLLISI